MHYGSNSRTSVNQLFANIVSSVYFIKNRELPLERIQFHSLNLHSICYKSTFKIKLKIENYWIEEFWGNPSIALKKTILVALQTCKHENSHIPLDDFDFNPNEVIIFPESNKFVLRWKLFYLQNFSYQPLMEIL